MKMYRKIVTMVLLAVLVSALIPTTAFAAVISVTTDKDEYLPGELVTVSGTADANSWVTVGINDPDDILLTIDQVQADALGAYEFVYGLLADAMTGTYTVDASAGIVVSTTFDVVETGAPVLAAIGDKTVNELELLTFTATATDDPADTQTFSLVDAPTGAAITASGIFTWTPTEAQGPDDYTFTVKVTDEFPLSDEEEITVTVNEVNVAPVLGAIGNKEVNELVELTFTATATDSDIPANTLTFSLVDAPTGAAITAGGVFTWTPTEAQGPDGYLLDVVVSDGLLTDSETILVTVDEVTEDPVTAELNLTKEWYHTGDTVSVTLNATGQNEDPTMTDIAPVWASSDSDYLLGEWLALIETGVNTSIFKGTFKLVGDTPGTGEILVSDGDWVWVQYWYGQNEEWDYAIVDNKIPTITIIEPLKNSITTG